MKIELSLLDQIQVASPCSASWDAMKGDDRMRFCSECSKHVYRFDGMSRGEILELLQEAEGGVCVRLARRRDGTIVTNDCPVGVERARRRRRLALLLALLPFSLAGAAFSRVFAPAVPPPAAAGTATPLAASTASGLVRLEELWDDALVWMGLRPKTTTVMGGCPAPPLMGKVAPPTPGPSPNPLSQR
jgi:hypothetical protein